MKIAQILNCNTELHHNLIKEGYDSTILSLYQLNIETLVQYNVLLTYQQLPGEPYYKLYRSIIDNNVINDKILLYEEALNCCGGRLYMNDIAKWIKIFDAVINKKVVIL
jgi:hypothetical protein